MQFLLPHVKLPVKSTGSNLPPLSTDQSSNCQLGEENSQQDFSQDRDESLTRDSEEHSIESRRELPHNEESINTVDHQTPLTTCVNSSRNHRKTAKSDADQAFVEYFQEKKRKVDTSSECPRKQFLLSLLPEVSDLPETSFRVFKRRVFELLDNLHWSDPPMMSNTASSHSGSQFTDTPIFSPESLSTQEYDSFGGTRPLATPSFQTTCENAMGHNVVML